MYVLQINVFNVYGLSCMALFANLGWLHSTPMSDHRVLYRSTTLI